VDVYLRHSVYDSTKLGVAFVFQTRLYFAVMFRPLHSY